jgi:hypothetical protein
MIVLQPSALRPKKTPFQLARELKDVVVLKHELGEEDDAVDLTWFDVNYKSEDGDCVNTVTPRHRMP